VHNKHHKTQEVRAGEIVRLGVVEEVFEVGISIIALGLLSVHPLARSIYNCVITFLLTELHSGFDFPWTPQNVVPFGLMTGSRRHHYHHRNGKHYYQKFFFHVDRLFGFFQKNDGTLNGDSVQPDPYIPASWEVTK
jgi:sterol desaturase/sphingolipid hydroxylase (fatty acid hydroxylase superfamily)